MTPISSIIKQEKKLEKSERAQVIKEIYQLYSSPLEAILRKKENWKRYITWLKLLKLDGDRMNNVTINRFKKTKLHLKPISITSLCFFLSHMKTNELYFIKSECIDKNNRGYSIGSYIIGLRKII